MFTVLTCIQEHDLRLVAWATAICLSSVAASLYAYRKAVAARDRSRTVWVLMAALLIGSGVWATHFMAMLAYHREMRVSFTLGLTLLSLVSVFGGMGLGLKIAATARTWACRAIGGAVCGLAIGLMHFIGVAAMQLPAQMRWSPGLVLAALAIGTFVAALAMTTAGNPVRLRRGLAAVGLMTLAICGLHFTGMAAVTLIPGPAPVAAGLNGDGELALSVGVLTGLILTAGVGMLVVDGVVGRLNRLHAALDSAPSAIAYFDVDGRLQFWSQGYAVFAAAYGLEVMRGVTMRAIIEKVYAKVTANGLYAGEDALGHASMDGGFNLAAPNGRWYQRRMQPARDGGYVVVLSDVTEVLELAERETEARRLADMANSAKSVFLANMSHEIRTPLNGVLGMVQVMGRDRLDPEQRERLEVIGQAGQSLLSVLNNVLDLSKIESGRLELETYPFDLAKALEASTAAFASLATQKDVDLRLDIDPLAPGVWLGDGQKLTQVLTNLVSNALKFTAEGEIELRVSRSSDGLSFALTDTGVGIPADRLDMIFDKFVQADASTTRRFGGTGLGLTICQDLVALMGGRLTVESREGVGSTFAFSLPLAPCAVTARDGDLATDNAEARVDPLRILAAEDNPTNQLILRALLAPLAAELIIVETGRQAVTAWSDAAFDLILMDAQMPEMNGSDACQEIRRLEREAGRPRVPILALTANVMRHQIEAYEAAGMDGYVAKPIDASALFSSIEAALDTAQAA